MIKKFIFFVFSHFIFIVGINAYTAYKQGDLVTYNKDEYYVLYDSDSSSNVLTLLKAEPLTVEEVEKYGVGHINNYSVENQHQVVDSAGYGGIVYYSSEQCGYINNEDIIDNCKTDYDSSDVKYVVDSWAKDRLNEKDLWKDNLGYNYRLITKEEILEYMNYSLSSEELLTYDPIANRTPIWFYSDKYTYWTMSSINKINSHGYRVNGILCVSNDGKIEKAGITIIRYATFRYATYYSALTIRPVVLLKKSALNKSNSSNNNSSSSNISSNIKDNSKPNSSSNINNNLVVSVPDTLTKISIIGITIGIILGGIGTIMYIYIRINRGKNEENN